MAKVRGVGAKGIALFLPITATPPFSTSLFIPDSVGLGRAAASVLKAISHCLDRI